MMKPSPNAAPTSPMFFERFSRVVPSAMQAIAVAIFPPLMPSMIAPEHQHPVTVVAEPRMRKPMAVPMMLTTSTGLRPTRSEIRPRIGAQTTWSSE